MEEDIRKQDAGWLHLYGQNKKAARRAVDNVRTDLEDDGGKMIYKLAHDRDENSKDVDGEEGSGVGGGSTVIKDGARRLVREGRGAVLKV